MATPSNPDAVKREVRLMRPVEYNDEIKRCSELLADAAAPTRR